MWLDNRCHGEQQNGKCLQIFEKCNHLQCTKILLQVSAYSNAVYRQFYDRISLSQFSIFQWYYKNEAPLCLEKNLCSKNSKSFFVKWQKNLFLEIIVLVKLLFLGPATNTISECSSSTLRRIKTHLRPTMTQSRLSHSMMLNARKEALGELTLIEIADGFCRKNEARLNIFWKFSHKQIPQHLFVKISVVTQTF